MSEIWRRIESDQAFLMAASVRSPGIEAYEIDSGRFALHGDATFECDPCSNAPGAVRSITRAPERPFLHVQARTGVVTRIILRPTRGDVQTIDREDQIAIGSRGGYPDRRYTWVQIVASDAEAVRCWDGSTHTINVDVDDEGLRRPESDFAWRGRTWYVDSAIDADSARYSSRGRSMLVAGSANHEIIYDRPNASLAITRWMNENPDVERVTHVDDFESYLYELPLHGPTPYLPHVVPVAAVLWSHRDIIERRARGAAPESRSEYSVWFIVPNPVPPPTLSRALWRGFHGR